jgi:subtilisin family serine protease
VRSYIVPLLAFAIVIADATLVSGVVRRPDSDGAVRRAVIMGRHYEKSEGCWYLVSKTGRWPVSSQVISVVFDRGADQDSITKWLEETGLSIWRSNSAGILDLCLPQNQDPLDALTLCDRSGLVHRASPDIMGTWSTLPDDEYYQLFDNYWHQWNLRPERVQAEHAWEIETGDTTVVIAVIDTGVELDHDDLKGNLWKNWGETANNDQDDDGNDFTDDRDGFYFTGSDSCCGADYGDGDVSATDPHGVRVAGIIAAQTNNDSVGVAGIAGGWYDDTWTAGDRGYGCLIMPLKLDYPNSAAIDDAICYAVDNGADIINMSFGADSTGCLDTAIDYADNNGVLMVAATNNGNSQVDYPARDPRV